MVSNDENRRGGDGDVDEPSIHLIWDYISGRILRLDLVVHEKDLRPFACDSPNFWGSSGGRVFRWLAYMSI